MQQKLRALQPTPDEEDVDPIDEETRARVVLSKLDEYSITVLRELARLENGIGQLISSGDGKYDFVDPFSKKKSFINLGTHLIAVTTQNTTDSEFYDIINSLQAMTMICAK